MHEISNVTHVISNYCQTFEMSRMKFKNVMHERVEGLHDF